MTKPRLASLTATLLIIISQAPAVAQVFTGVDAGPTSEVKTFDSQGTETFSFLAYGGFTGGVRVAAGDVNGDGLDDIITAAGPGGNGHVKVFNANGALLASFFAYGPSFNGGVFVGSGDVNNDNVDDIITGADSGAGPHVKVFNGTTGAELASFFAYGAGFTGGVRVAAGDVNGDNFDDIITGAGDGGFAHVKVFSGANNSELRSFFAYGPSFTGGVFVAGGDINNDGFDDIITGSEVNGHVKAFSGANNAELASFFAFPGFQGGVRVAAGDINADGFDDIIVGVGTSSGTGGPTVGGHVKVIDGSTLAELDSFFAFGPTYAGGVFVAASDVIPEPSAAVLLAWLAPIGVFAYRGRAATRGD